MPFYKILDLSMALLIEIYREFGMKFDEAMAELNKQLSAPEAGAKKRREPAPDNEASMALLMGMMGGSDFKGATG